MYDFKDMNIMEKLPTEVLMLLTQYMGGVDFVNFRQTCKRHKDIADHMELKTRPALWRGYLFHDFPRPCLESVIPWLNTADKDDPILWKELYVKLNKIILLSHASLKFTHLSLDSLQADDIKFMDNYLFVIVTLGHVRLIGIMNHIWKWPRAAFFKHEVGSPVRPYYYSKCVGVFKHDSRAFRLIPTGVTTEGGIHPCDLLMQGPVVTSCQDWSLHRLPPAYNHGKKGAGISQWANSTIAYRQDYVSGEDELTVCTHPMSDSSGSNCKIHLKTTLDGLKSLVFNGKRIVALCKRKMICIIPNSYTKPVDVYSYELPSQPLKVKMMGDLVILLTDEGKLEVAEALTDKAGRMYFSEWQVLLDGNVRQNGDYIMASHKVTDFVLEGQVFAAILDNGTVYLSFLETVELDSLKKNLQIVYQVAPVSENQGQFTRLSINQETGLVLAMAETYMVDAVWATTIHVLYVDRGSACTLTEVVPVH